MLTLNNLKPKKGSNIQNKRIGRGQASGQGTQAGKGHKGQKARSGGGVRFGFSGGGKPLYMRLPKIGFNNSDFQKNFAEVSLAVIDKKYVANEEVSKETLISKGILKGQRKNLPVKVLNGNLTKPLKFVKIAAFSKTALDMVSKNNGVVEK